MIGQFSFCFDSIPFPVSWGVQSPHLFDSSSFFTFFNYLVTGSILCSLILACQTCTLASLVLTSSAVRAHSTIRGRLLTLLLSGLLFHGQVYICRNIAPLIRSRELMNFSNMMGYEWLILSSLTLDSVPHIHTVHPIGHSICTCRYLECRVNL